MSDATARARNLFARNRGGERVGVHGVCSAHPLVLRAAVALSVARGQVALVEATCNQVNQDGGYTGMRPADFRARVLAASRGAGLTEDRLVLGGDHLGPQPWRNRPAAEAMDKAEEMVTLYVAAGFTKIHLDCSMRCVDDPETLPESLIAERAARLAAAAEAASAEAGTSPFYVIGTEVPPPGGMGSGHEIVPTPPEAVAATWQAHADAFRARGLDAAFERVLAVVVQPGLDFGNEDIVHYGNGSEALSARVLDLGEAVYEAHSTDYQRPTAYRRLVEGHFAILKVGPAATFALREALYALEAIEAELVEKSRRSNLRAALEAAMLAVPAHWAGHYSGSAEQQAYLRHFSYSDRLRYYWTAAPVEAAAGALFANLSAAPIPLPLISQFLPQHFDAVAEKLCEASPTGLAIANIQRALIPYADACGAHCAN